jgi:hypothetical protein
MRRQNLHLLREKNSFENSFEILGLYPEDPKPQLQLETSRKFVDALSSVMRRLSVLEEIGPTVSRKVDAAQLWHYLGITASILDYREVAASFDPAFTTQVVTFEKPITLLRIYGGTTNQIGRYFFCCLWRLDSIYMNGWSDASGLATPRGNLRSHLAATTIPAGATAVVGTVADNFLDELGHPLRGGNTQIFIPHVGDFPFQAYRAAGPGGVSEILVKSDDRILRFRQ